MFFTLDLISLISCLSVDRLLWGPGIFSATRDDHRKYRKIMMPAFSAANLRGMIPMFYEVAEKVRLSPPRDTT
jgi:cytochrome P450